IRPPASTNSRALKAAGMTWRAASVASWTRRLKKNGSVPIKSASDRLRRRLAKAASIVWPLFASTTPISIPRAEAAAVTSLVTAADGELLGLTSSPIRLAAGTSSCSSPNSFAANSARGKLMPVALPPGRAKLTTRPRATGSSVTLKTIGMVAVVRRQGRCGASASDDQGDLAADQLGRHRRQPIVLTLGEAIFDRCVAPHDVTGFGQTLAKNSHGLRARGSRASAEISYHRHLRLLRPRRARPCRGGGGAEQREECAAPHSITPSARASTVDGIWRSRVLAVFRLITISNLVGVCTGRSLGFSPLRMRST